MTRLWESTLLQIRIDFAAWAARRQMFETLNIISQMHLSVSSASNCLASISFERGGNLTLHSFVVENYERYQEECFFLLMHELRHLAQTTSCREWEHLLDFSPLWQAMNDRVASKLLQEAGLKNFDDDVDLKHDITSWAADAAIHEDLVRLFSPDILTRMGVLSHAQDLINNPDVDVAMYHPLGVADIEQVSKQVLEPGQDWLYYAKAMVNGMAMRIRREPAFAQSILERGVLRLLRGHFYSGEAASDAALYAMDAVLKRAQGTAKAMFAAQPDYAMLGPGTEALDHEELYEARREINSAIKELVRLIKSSVNTGQRPRRQERRSYAQPHLFLAEAPGQRIQYCKAPHEEVILVLDSSGSMWIPELLAPMAAMAHELQKRGSLRQAYCCDVRLHPLTISTVGSITFKGAGGTVWSPDHHTQIINDLKLSKKPTIYYCTDEAVNGLEEACKDERVNLKIINIPKLIQSDVYQRAKL